MINKTYKDEVCYLLACYKEHKINRSKLYTLVKELFYCILAQRDITLDAISIYYVISSIVDNDDLSDIAFDELVNHLSDICEGKCCHNHFLTVELRIENDEFTNIFRNIIRKIQKKTIIDSSESEWLTNTVSNRIKNLSTLSDLLIERIAILLSMIDINLTECFDLDMVSTVHITSDEICKEELINKICDYIDCLEGKRCVFISVRYGTNLTVNII